MDEKGIIKFQCRWIEGDPFPQERIDHINRWRDRLYRLGWIGAYENGIGFGNISIRLPDSSRFIITGSGTGRLKVLDVRHYTLVEEVDLARNTLTCRGPIKASSESMTHAAVYLSATRINAVIHTHQLELWKRLMDRMPTTSRSAEYGTPEMAREVFRLFRETDLVEKKIFVMGGHEEGIMTFGRDLKEAGDILLKFSEESKSLRSQPAQDST